MNNNINLYLKDGRSLMITLYEARNYTVEILRHLWNSNEFTQLDGRNFYNMLIDERLPDGTYALSRLDEVVNKAKNNTGTDGDESLYIYMMLFCSNHRSYYDYVEDVAFALDKYQADNFYFEDTKRIIADSFDEIVNNQQEELLKKCETLLDKLID